MQSESLPRLRAPRDHGAVLAYPPLDDVGAILAENARRLSAALEPDGRPLAELRALARREIVAAAKEYHAAAGEPIPNFTGDRIILAGHQPELFHPGVWVKNFALQGLARRHNAVPLNLIVDNDIAKPALLRLPADGHVAKPAFDAAAGDVPYEERTVQDEALFASLAERCKPIVRAWPFRPLLATFWNEAVRLRSRTPLLGERLAAARRAMERAWGLQPFEVPLSRVCQTEAFACFAVHLVHELQRFHTEHNRALADYRRRHELRSPLHPLPDLVREGRLWEMPFWAWRTGSPRRHRLWATVERNDVVLFAGKESLGRLRGDAVARVQQWRQLAQAGVKIRTRALTTTLFARLLLGELFIHGIGGGKYDEVTDVLLRDFFHIEPPRYLILTATLLLPLPRFPGAAADQQQWHGLARDLHWNPQRHWSGGSGEALVQEKLDWIRRPTATHAERVERFHRLRQINEALLPLVANAQAHARQAAAEAERRARLHDLHSSREYAFSLYPDEMLREFYQRFVH